MDVKENIAEEYTSEDYEFAESMVRFVMDKNYVLRIATYEIWAEFYRISFDKTKIEPPLSPGKLRQRFIYEVLPNVDLLDVTVEHHQQLEKFSTDLYMQFLYRTKNGYKLRSQLPFIEDMLTEIEIIKILSEPEFAFLSKSALAFIDWNYFEEFQHIIYLDKKKRFYLSLLVQTEEERFNRVEIPHKECMRRILRIISNFRETKEFPSIFNGLPDFEHIIRYHRLLKWMTEIVLPKAANAKLNPEPANKNM